jgi:hypothetical protein
VHPKVAQELMRHSDINLTMSRYTHTLTGQTSRAIDSLPDLTTSARKEKSVMTGTDNRPADCVSKTKQIMPEKNFAICLAKLGTENGNQPESTGIQADMGAHKKTVLINEKDGFLSKKLKWAGLDSNQRRLTPTGLQPVPFSHSGTNPI